MAVSKIAGIRGRVDKTGIASLVQPWHCDTLEEAFNVGELELVGLPRVGRQFGHFSDDTRLQGFQVGVEYEGLPSVYDEDGESFDYAGDFTKENIDSFPDIDWLKKEFGALVNDKGNITFPEKLPKGAGGGTGAGGFALAADANKDQKNPMFGKKDWPLFGAVYSRTYPRRKFPRQILRKIGSTIEKPPGIYTPKDRNWLFLMPGIRGRGNVVEITERLTLSPPGGWPPHIQHLYQASL